MPVTGLAVFAVLLTTALVAIVVRALMPTMPWSVAIALGAIVAPPDAVAASAVLRPLRPPHQLLTVLEGESLLNDATALLIYRLAVGATLTGGFSPTEAAPRALLALAGSVIAGTAAGWLLVRSLGLVHHVPTIIILQFISTFAVWITAERMGLSAILTTVSFAIFAAQTSPQRTPARHRIPTYAVWETVVFALNILAFIFIGLQIRPILESLAPGTIGAYSVVAAAVLVTVIVARFIWQMLFSGIASLCQAQNRTSLLRHLVSGESGFHPTRPALAPNVGSAVVISWAGMRGIVSLAAALALPLTFPYRDLITLTAFTVVLGTLVIQGLTLESLMRVVNLRDDDPVGQELRVARVKALAAVDVGLAGNPSPVAATVREQFKGQLAALGANVESDETRTLYDALYSSALLKARQSLVAMRQNSEIGDDAFHQLEEQLDWLEMAGGVTMNKTP